MFSQPRVPKTPKLLVPSIRNLKLVNWQTLLVRQDGSCNTQAEPAAERGRSFLTSNAQRIGNPVDSTHVRMSRRATLHKNRFPHRKTTSSCPMRTKRPGNRPVAWTSSYVSLRDCFTCDAKGGARHENAIPKTNRDRKHKKEPCTERRRPTRSEITEMSKDEIEMEHVQITAKQKSRPCIALRRIPSLQLSSPQTIFDRRSPQSVGYTLPSVPARYARTQQVGRIAAKAIGDRNNNDAGS